MALFRRLFYRKPPDRLLEISERVYVFDCCFSSESLGDKAFKNYLGNIVFQLQDYFPDASFMVCNFKEGDKKSRISDILSEYDMPVMDYPWQYEGCPLLPLEMIHHFLRSSESWLSLEGQHNVLLMHCERGGWPVLAFMLAGLLLYRKQYSGEQKTLEMVYKQAPKELLHLFCSLNPQPSHLRYLHYITRQSSESDWPPKDKPFTLECIILRVVPQFDVKGGFRPVVRVYGQDPLNTTNRCPKILFSTPISKKVALSYRQESAGLKINARCHVQGDVVLECIHVDEDLEQETMMFRIMCNTAFVESDILVLNSEDIDVAWNVKDQFPRDFRAEVLFSEFVEAESEMNLEVETRDGDVDYDDLEGASIEEFFEAEEIFSNTEVYTDTQILRTKNAMVDIVLNSEIHVINDNADDKLESGVVKQSYSNFTIKSVFEFDEVELESLFSAVIPKLDDSSKSEGRRKSLGSKSDKVHLIELRRANNTEIMLTKVKIPLSDLVSAALSLDDSVLEADQVDNLIKFCPTKDEMELLKGFSGDKEKLGKCEQFFLELMKVPRVESKLRVFSFKIQFFQQVSDLKKNLNIINSTCEQIRSSVKFKEIMKKILYLGNMLNQGTARGSAIGFRLDSLLKLTDTHATNSKMTLMHYLCKVLASRSPHLLDFHDGLTSLEAASKIQLKSLAEEMQAIIRGLEKVEFELNASESDGPVTKNFQRTLKEFIAVAGADVQSLSSLYSAVGRNADALALYFGEDPTRCPFEQVISTLMNFVVMFRRAHQENHKHAELEKKKALKDAEAEKFQKASNLSNKRQDMSLSDQLQQSLDKAKAANQQGKVVG